SAGVSLLRDFDRPKLLCDLVRFDGGTDQQCTTDAARAHAARGKEDPAADRISERLAVRVADDRRRFASPVAYDPQVRRASLVQSARVVTTTRTQLPGMLLALA